MIDYLVLAKTYETFKTTSVSQTKYFVTLIEPSVGILSAADIITPRLLFRTFIDLGVHHFLSFFPRKGLRECQMMNRLI